MDISQNPVRLHDVPLTAGERRDVNYTPQWHPSLDFVN